MPKKMMICFLLLFLTGFTQIASATPNWSINSPFGYRIHPIFGTTKFHDGVDFPLDFGTPVPVAAAGEVVFTGWYGGYGQTVIVRHNIQEETLYAHLSEINVGKGQYVAKDYIVGFVGSTGYSTGPHLHLRYDINGTCSDPVPFLLAQGWGLDGIISSGSGTPQPTPDDLKGYEGFNEKSWSFDGFYNMGGVLSETIITFTNACEDGVKRLKEAALPLLTILAVIDLTLYIYLAFWEIRWTDILVKFLKYGFIMSLVVNWQEVTNDFVRSFFIDNASTFTSDGALIVKNMSKPELIVQKGASLINPVFTYIASLSGYDFIGSVNGVIGLIIALLLLACFMLIALQVMLYYLEFYIMAMFAVLSIVFSVLFPTKFVAEGGVGAFISSGIKLMIVGVIVGLTVTIIAPLQPVPYELTKYIFMLFASCGFVALTFTVPKRILRLLGGEIRF